MRQAETSLLRWEASKALGFAVQTALPHKFALFSLNKVTNQVFSVLI